MKKQQIIFSIILLLSILVAFFYTNYKDSPKTIVMMVSKEMSKSHMTIYGYPGKTTPYLEELKDNNDLIVLTKAFTNHSKTAQNTKALLRYNTSQSILDIYKKEKYDIYAFGSNIKQLEDQNLIKIPSSSMLIEQLGKTSTKDRLFFIYLNEDTIIECDTSKNPNLHTTQGYIGKKKLTKKKLLQEVNTSLLSFDCLIKELVDTMQQQPTNDNSLWYIAERGIDINIGNKNYLGFNTAYVPAFIWMNKSSISHNKEAYQGLTSNKTKHFSTEYFANTITQFSLPKLKGIKTHNLASKDYQINTDSLSIFKGRRKFKNRENKFFYQQNSALIIKELNQEERIFPHRINSIAKLNEIYNDGFRSFELDVIFDENGSNNILVGHDIEDTDITLHTFLQNAPLESTDRIWLDFKNLNTNNETNVFTALQSLDKEFGLKNKILLETNCTAPLVSKFSKAGWNTSYYLPTTRLLQYINSNDSLQLKQTAQTISEQILVQNLNAISFDNRLYTFVKDLVEPKIQDSIKYHIWFGPRLKDPDFSKKLQRLPFFNDKRVYTILCNYESEFNL
ncbi:hypothetical protein SCB49_10040 [unidentified eubacterium SCB49]|nr:hypothetical protein SCB49_10040 [unidentified eubacterium SCB49]